MRIASGTALVIATLLVGVPVPSATAQIGGLIKKKAVEAAKGKAEDKVDAPAASPADSCGPITPQKIQDFLRGLQAEGSARYEFDSMVAREESTVAQSGPRIKACRDGETGGTTYQQIMIEGFTGTNPPSSPAAVQAQMDKNKAKWDEYLDKKCGKEPKAVSHNPGDTYRKAHANGAKTAGMSEYCYDVLGDRVIAFCKLSKKDQATAVEKGLRVEKTREWLFTADEAKAIQPLCNDLMAALRKAGNTLAG